MPEGELTVFQRKLLERRAKEQAAAASKPAPKEEFDADLVPEDPYEKTDGDRELDYAIENIDILEAYARWCGKMTPKVGRGQRESIMISCPVPGHQDANPSAWINLDKQTWYCAKCAQGGDAHDLAAFHFGFPVPGYKDDSRFHDLRIKMAGDFGYHMERYPGGVSVLVGPSTGSDVDETPEGEPDPETPGTVHAGTAAAVAAPEPTVDPEDQVGDADVIDLYPGDDFDEEISFPKLDWRTFVPKDTFIDTYMRITCVDDIAEEFHFGNALLALGFALGRNARLDDLVPVYGNLFIVDLGHSGSGKSKAARYLNNLLKEALPHDWSDPSSRGVRKINAPGSAEVLIHNFQKPIVDPSNPKSTLGFAPVSGLIDFNELASLIGRTNRMGSALKPTLMQFYDMDDLIATSSMTTGVKEAHDAFGSALTSTQPKALKELLGRADDDSGFLNRWLFVAGPEKKRIPVGGVRVDMGAAVDPLKRILAWSAAFDDDEYVLWSQEAVDSFTEFFHDVIEPDKRRADNALLTRIDLTMKKLILLFSSNKLETTVSTDTVFEAIQCYDWIKQCYNIPAGQIGNSLQQEISEAVLYQARKQYELDKKGVTLNQVAKALKRRKYPHDMLLKVMDSLVKLGFLDVETSKAGQVGRPTVRYRYVG